MVATANGSGILRQTTLFLDAAPATLGRFLDPSPQLNPIPPRVLDRRCYPSSCSSSIRSLTSCFFLPASLFHRPRFPTPSPSTRRAHGKLPQQPLNLARHPFSLNLSTRVWLSTSANPNIWPSLCLQPWSYLYSPSHYLPADLTPLLSSATIPSPR